MKKRSVLAILIGASVMLTAAGCASTSSAGDEPAEEGLTIGLVIPFANDYYQNIQTALEEVVEADGGEVIVANSENDGSKEAANVQNLITRQVDAIIIQPANAAAGSIATMKTVKAAGIPLICFGNCTDDAASPEVVDGAIQSDNEALGTSTGEMAAEYIKASLDGTAKIAILNCDSFEVCVFRKNGFKEALEAAGVTVEYVADQEAFVADKATTVATNIITANPDIDLFWSASHDGTVGEIAAIAATGASMKVFGTDMSVQLAEAILDGQLQATTGQDEAATATGAYEMAKKVIDGGTNSPIEVLVPGIGFNSTAPDEINAYLGQ